MATAMLRDRSTLGWAFISFSLAVVMLPATDASARTRDDVRALQQEVETLKQGQAQLQKDLEELRKQVQQGARGAPAQPAFKPADLTIGASPVLGSADAPVTLFEFSDYQCPFCARHATNTMPELVKQYVDAGKLRIVMRELPIESLHARAFAAATAASCAGAQGKYWQMHDLLFANQRAMADENLQAHADALGLDATAYAACVAATQTSDAIRASQKEGSALGISGTPSFVAGLTDPGDPNKVHVTQFIRGAQPLTAFQNVIDGLLKEAEAARGGAGD